MYIKIVMGITDHKVLYRDVTGARCDGYANSVTRTGAADAANVRPKPIMNLSDTE